MDVVDATVIAVGLTPTAVKMMISHVASHAVVEILLAPLLLAPLLDLKKPIVLQPVI